MIKIPYGRQYIDKTDIAAVVDVLRSDFITQGPKIDEFENKFAKYVGTKYALAFNNGTSALLACMFAAGISDLDEVITTPYTFAATANSFVWFGAKPVFVDIEENSFNIDVTKIEKAITKKTRAIIGVDFAGVSCDWDSILKIAKKYKLLVIDDAAHSLGSTYKNRMVGSIADMTCFSFHPVKTITTGEGGMVTTNNRDFYDRLKIFRNHGITKDLKIISKKHEGQWYYEMLALGLNLRLTDIQAALGASQLKKINGFIKKRKDIVSVYNKNFSDLPVVLPSESSFTKSAWHLYPVRLETDKLADSRKVIFEKLQESGLGVQVHYIPVHLHPYYRNKFGFKKGDFPNAEKLYEQEISLPLFPKMTKGDIDYVVKTFRRIINKYKSQLLKSFEKVQNEKNPNVTKDMEAVVVLSGESGGSSPGSRSDDTEARMVYGIELYRKIQALGGFPTLVINGTDFQNQIMATIAKKAGLKKIVFIKNPTYPIASTDTQMKGLSRLKYKNLAIVTHGWHGPRVTLNAKRRLPGNMSFSLFLLDRKSISSDDIGSEIQKIQKYFQENR